jgi:moderate conductance mechanosensitive channel
MDSLTLLLTNYGEWGHLVHILIRVVVILAIAWGLLHLSHKLIVLLRAHMQQRTGDPEQTKRLETLGRAFRYISGVLITLIAGMLVLSEVGISIAPILASAGVIGIAVGFGAQSLIKDYFTGFFLLVENQVRQGDVVQVADKGGLVEEITLRYIRLRDYEGTVHFIPNSQVVTVTNRSRGFAFAVIDIHVAYKENTDRVYEVMRRVGAEQRADAEVGDRILEDLEIAGVDKWDNSAVVIRCRFKVRPLEQWGVRREYLRRLKMAFDAEGIEIPFPHLTIYAGQDSKAVPMPIRMLEGERAE